MSIFTRQDLSIMQAWPLAKKIRVMASEQPKMCDYCINRLGCGKVLDYLGIAY